MEISLTAHSVVFLFSCAVGGLLGAFYDVFRIIRVAFDSKWLSVFFQDLIFCILSAFSIILLIFYTNSGTVRWFSLFGCFMSFVLYHMTVGRFVMFISKKIIEFIKKVFDFIYKITVIPVKTAVLFLLTQLKKLAGFLWKIIKTIKANLHYKKEKRKAANSASKGFGLYKNNTDIDGKTAKKIAEIIKKDSVKNQKTLEKPK